jgi:hypothetical protein
MTVGEGIFYGALVLGLVGLYAVTKDRWKWKQIAKWGLGVPFVLLVLGLTGMWAYSKYEDRPTPQTTFGGLTLTSTEADVRFAKGEPTKILEDGRWVYHAGSGSKEDRAGYVVRFKDGKVRYILYAAAPDNYSNPWLQGFTMEATHESVLQKLGMPDHTSTSEDGLQRMISYSKFNTFYTFEQAKVRDFGIYDPATGPMAYTKAASAAQGKRP